MSVMEQYPIPSQYVTTRRSGHERQGKKDEDCSKEYVGQ